MAACGGPRPRGSAGGSSPDWNALNPAIPEDLVTRGAEGYENARAGLLWNARIPPRYPGAILRVRTASDVQEALAFAGRHDLGVAIRGGGHHFNGPVLRQDSLVLDLGSLKDIQVDAARQSVSVQPGVTGRELAAALAPHGLAFPVGHCSGVPLSGYLLNGGFGWNSGSWGPACVSVTGAEVVTADGKAATIDADTQPDLFWALRGAGTEFPAVVTRFHLRVHPLPGAIRTASLLFRDADLDPALDWLARVQPALPPEVELAAAIISPPEPARAQGAPERALLIAATAFAGAEDQATQWLASLADGPHRPAPFFRSGLVASSFDGLFAGIDGLFPPAHRYASDHLWTDAAPVDLIGAAREDLLHPPVPGDFLLLAFGPNLPPGAPPLPDMALSTSGRIYAGIYAVWDDPAGDGDNQRWVRRVSAALDPHRSGRYVGEADIQAPDHLPQCFSPAAWQRLGALRMRYDPDHRLG